ncbi:MAG: helix-turn-helix transcriptional regulator [Oscillospiraceae bacterium]|jgi:predicted transcriptional regulator YheO|nr:helix-turn-helix transcriptional regulator [Oscillospiraceae bacterium]
MNSAYITGLLGQISKALASHFGPECEVAVHDLTKGYENTIIAIENGHVTGRRVGDDASEIVLCALRNKTGAEDNIGYLSRTSDGRLLKSSSVYIRNEEGEVAAIFGVNYDITGLSHANRLVGRFIETGREKKDYEVSTIVSNVSDLLDRLLEESVDFVGKPVALMGKDDKIKGIHYLEEKGAFLIKKAGDKVSRYYDISKYTLYNYLDSEPTE